MPTLTMISDTHTMHDHIPELEPSDILLHAGDITNRGELSDLASFNLWLEQQKDKFEHRVIIPGNHDLGFEENWEAACSAVPAASAILNQTSYTANGLKIYGEPRTREFYSWAFNVPHALMEPVWEKVPTDIDILLTHGPPHGVGDTNQSGILCGCPFLRQFILDNKPPLVVCGHIHEGHGVYQLGDTLVVNAAICTALYAPTNPPIVLTL